MTKKDRVAQAFHKFPELSSYLKDELGPDLTSQLISSLEGCYEINAGQRHSDRWDVYKVTRLIDGKKFSIGDNIEGYGTVKKMIEVAGQLFIYLEQGVYEPTYSIDSLP